MPLENDHNDKENEQEKLLSSFLKTFVNNYETDSTAFQPKKQKKSGKNKAEVQRLDIQDYQSPIIEQEMQHKITRFQQITDAIESKVIKPPSPSTTKKTKDNYKVNYRQSLNDGQYLAATTTKGPVLVIAGAGSGKTRTIIYRISYLLENKVLPEKILILTFTRKAAQEMVNRSSELLQDKSVERVMRGTYHAFSNMILRRYAAMLGISPNFTIIDSGDSEDVIDLIRQELKLTKKSRAFPRKSRIRSIISSASNRNLKIKTVLEREFPSLLEFVEDIKMIAQLYKRYKKGNNLFDYDDLMEFFRDSLRDNIPFRRNIQKAYSHIMVDEFQDTNVVQKEIVDYIAAGSRNIMVVGDDSQSIYAFRGANFENILTFPATYPDCKIIKLEQNYRSNQDILNFTNTVANKAFLGYKKHLFSTNKNDFKPFIGKFYDQQEEAEFIVSRILDLRERDIPLNQIAVLYRSSFHGNYIQAELLKRNIPYIVVGGLRFTERRHIKDIIAYLRLALNPYDAVSWHRILKLIQGIGKVTASKIVTSIQDNKGVINFENFDKKKYGQELIRLQNVLQEVMQDNITLLTKINLLIKYYEPLLKTLETDYEVRLQDLEILNNLSARYEAIDKFLSDFALDPPSTKFQDRNAPLMDESEDKPITLSTIHSAKGLEWYCVFVPHLLDGVFPSSRSIQYIEQLEEERRLFYVATSRAKEQLYLTYPSYLSLWDSFFTKPSRFMVEVENDKFRVWKS